MNLKKQVQDEEIQTMNWCGTKPLQPPEAKLWPVGRKVPVPVFAHKNSCLDLE